MEKSQVYKCGNCAVIIAVLSPGNGEGQLSCCGKEMINVTPSEAKQISQQYGMTAPGTP
jgi:desulfoferrodoxin-like iron-binding protein